MKHISTITQSMLTIKPSSSQLLKEYNSLTWKNNQLDELNNWMWHEFFNGNKVKAMKLRKIKYKMECNITDLGDLP